VPHSSVDPTQGGVTTVGRSSAYHLAPIFYEGAVVLGKGNDRSTMPGAHSVVRFRSRVNHLLWVVDGASINSLWSCGKPSKIYHIW
jgi:hypothetical protein